MALRVCEPGTVDGPVPYSAGFLYTYLGRFSRGAGGAGGTGISLFSLITLFARVSFITFFSVIDGDAGVVCKADSVTYDVARHVFDIGYLLYVDVAVESRDNLVQAFDVGIDLADVFLQI